MTTRTLVKILWTAPGLGVHPGSGPWKPSLRPSRHRAAVPRGFFR